MTLRPYPRVRQSGIEWLGDVPEHWLTTRLRFVMRLNPSKTELSQLPADTEISFLPMEAIGEDGSLRLDGSRPLGEVLSGYSYFRDGDVAIAKITPCFENGKGALMRGLLGGVGFGTTELIVARPDLAVVTAEFIHWLFQSTQFRLRGEGEMYGAGGQKRVPDDFVRNFPVALPPIKEQAAIATFLDRETGKIDALVEEQKRLIELLKEKRQAVISHAVTKGLNPGAPMKDSGVEWLGEVPEHWEQSRAGRFIQVISGFAFPSNGFTDEEEDVRLLRGINVGVGETRWDEVVRWKRLKNDRLEAFELRTDDLVLGMDRPWISAGVRIAKVESKDVPSLLLQRVAALRTDERLNVDFLYLQLQSDSFLHHFLPETTGVSVPHISPSQVASFPITVPPIEEQLEIVGFVARETSKIGSLVKEAENAITLLQERRTALISAAVTGKIDIRGDI